MDDELNIPLTATDETQHICPINTFQGFIQKSTLTQISLSSSNRLKLQMPRSKNAMR